MIPSRTDSDSDDSELRVSAWGWEVGGGWTALVAVIAASVDSDVLHRNDRSSNRDRNIFRRSGLDPCGEALEPAHFAATVSLVDLPVTKTVR